VLWGRGEWFFRWFRLDCIKCSQIELQESLEFPTPASKLAGDPEFSTPASKLAGDPEFGRHGQF
jgi:hypothetical protein